MGEGRVMVGCWSGDDRVMVGRWSGDGRVPEESPASGLNRAKLEREARPGAAAQRP